MSAASEKLQIFFDGACPLCCRKVRLYRSRDLFQRINWIDIAAPDFNPAAFGLDANRVNQEMHALLPDGRVVTGVEALREIWRALPPRGWTRLLLVLLRLPGAMPLARILYRLFARNRYRLTGRCTPAQCKA
jgi:predicted DCC family thiol-disulfide oxidoreductase YuxK